MKIIYVLFFSALLIVSCGKQSGAKEGEYLEEKEHLEQKDHTELTDSDSVPEVN